MLNMEVFARLRPQTIEMNTEFVRSQFPGLKDDFIFFDNAGGSQIAQQVIEKINDYLVDVGYLTRNAIVGETEEVLVHYDDEDAEKPAGVVSDPSEADKSG